MNRLFIV